ncbi:hypothetical protein M1116_02635 [Patescibacteria group bacterium]|nr:hypothetical protein [Patescibacteria group bacterium]
MSLHEGVTIITQDYVSKKGFNNNKRLEEDPLVPTPTDLATKEGLDRGSGSTKGIPMHGGELIVPNSRYREIEAILRARPVYALTYESRLRDSD